jgi:uncharacterized protein (DUF1810 family)
MSSAASFTLERFVAAQAPVYDDVLEELRAGRKTSHWMWFVFPQLKGLGRSEMAREYGLDGLAEAAAYLDHAVLGSRLRECTDLVNAIDGSTASDIFGAVDAMKFRSSMTLFERVAGPASPFSRAIEKYYAGQRDDATLSLTGRGPS